MLVRVRFFGEFRELLNKETVTLNVRENGTVKDVIYELARRNDPKILGRILNEKGEVRSEIIILVKGRNIQNFKGLETKVEENDVVYIFPIATGGEQTTNKTSSL